MTVKRNDLTQFIQFKASPGMANQLAVAAREETLNQSVLLRRICRNYLAARVLGKESTNEKEPA